MRLVIAILLLALCPKLHAGERNGTLPWSVDLPTAQARARAEGKSVLIHFSGSDWCGWCMKLRKEVFVRQEFEAYAKSNLVLVAIDFPKHKAVPEPVQAANQRLAQHLGVQGFPTLVLLDGQGNRMGNVNYGQGGAKAFVAELDRLLHPPPDPGPDRATPTQSAPGSRKRSRGTAVRVSRS